MLLPRSRHSGRVQVGLFHSGFDRLAHGSGNISSSRQQQLLTSGTRTDKAKHRVRIVNYHRNNQDLYSMYPGLHHHRGSLLALEATRKLPLAPRSPSGHGSHATSRDVLGLRRDY